MSFVEHLLCARPWAKQKPRSKAKGSHGRSRPGWKIPGRKTDLKPSGDMKQEFKRGKSTPALQCCSSDCMGTDAFLAIGKGSWITSMFQLLLKCSSFGVCMKSCLPPVAAAQLSRALQPSRKSS